ncbi:Hypothetical protein AA314_05579 [Archangium gephyra]|uniref:Uncharacterized protein n=1 Tax=Archangium gephyra TaxID=48 RepID=A0AAC8QAZ8_9BACT|nr:Hypothetical protein AA314_05579 [Archangium gephyra]
MQLTQPLLRLGSPRVTGQQLFQSGREEDGLRARDWNGAGEHGWLKVCPQNNRTRNGRT